MILIGNWTYPTTIKFGPGRIKELLEACEIAGINRPLLVTDKVLAQLEITTTTLNLLKNKGIQAKIFSDVDPNPNEKNLSHGVETYNAGKHDGVIAFGGGSSLDLGKMIAFMSGQSRPIWDFEDIDDWWTRADVDAIDPIVAIPTTAGTGSEVGRASVITNSITHEKKIIFHPKVLPTVVICDPELTIGMPKNITAGTGLDAFAHCVEAYSSPHYHPMSQGIALEGMRLVKDYLPRAYADGTDIEARSNMMSAAMMGATAFLKGLGAIHALSHPIGAMFNTHHGTTNAVCMPAVLELNATKISNRFDKAAAYLGIEGGFDGFQQFVQSFNDHFGIPRSLSELGVSEEKIDELIPMALADPSCSGNPVKLTTKNVEDLFSKLM